jgi:H+-transporting ATPase
VSAGAIDGEVEAAVGHRARLTRPRARENADAAGVNILRRAPLARGATPRSSATGAADGDRRDDPTAGRGPRNLARGVLRYPADLPPATRTSGRAVHDRGVSGMNTGASSVGAPAPSSPRAGAEQASVAQTLASLGVDPREGLTAAESAARLAKYGPNAVEQKERSALVMLLGGFRGPMPFMIEAAAVVSAFLRRWEDFIIITALLLFNVGLGFWQDRKASNALAALRKSLAPDATALRDGAWAQIPARGLVPGDIVKIRLGMIVPADLRLVSGAYASIDQAALTGESVPAEKKVGDPAYSGSVVRKGEMEGVVTATGGNTLFGRTAKLVAGAGAVSHTQKAMFEIGDFLIVVATGLAVIMVSVSVYRDIVARPGFRWDDLLSILQFVLVLLVASVPVAMPAVFSMTMSLGALALSKQKAIVSRLSAIEEMAGVDILCTDKTGTLTKNQLAIGAPILFEAKDEQETLVAAAFASRGEDRDPIDDAILAAVRDKSALAGWKQTAFVPFDPVTKRTEATLTDPEGHARRVAKGAPAAIVDLARPDAATARRLHDAVTRLAQKGNRALAVARSEDGGATWQVLGLLPMFDPPRDDSKETIARVRERGVEVKMITGDDTAIARETARELDMGDHIIAAQDAFPSGMDPDHVPAKVARDIERADGYARVFPEHKYAIVKALQQRGHLVAMTGDGVNDAPALKQADCGVAVSGATDAARSAAALILTAPGLSVILAAFDEARRIFGRISSYTLYRVALTVDIMFLVVLSTVFFNYQPLTAIMVVLLALLDDVPIMAIAYDHTEVPPKPVRWEMRRTLIVASVIGAACIIQSFLLLFFGIKVLTDPAAGALRAWLGLHGVGELRTVMFLQLLAGGHLVLLLTRGVRSFWRRPHPSWVLLGAIFATQFLAVVICAAGLLIPAISWRLIGVVWAYDLVWMFLTDATKLAIYRALDHLPRGQRRAADLVNVPLLPNATRP